MQQLSEQHIYTLPERRKPLAREQENMKLVQQIYEHFKRGDIKALLKLLSVNIEWQLPEIENVPFAGKRRGHEEMGQFFESLVDTQEVQHFDPREFIASGDKVLALGHYAWRVKSTGREFGGDFAHVFTVHDGKVVKFHEYMDTAAAAAAHKKDISD
jgi:ketosteroid isomerase-like protein